MRQKKERLYKVIRREVATGKATAPMVQVRSDGATDICSTDDVVAQRFAGYVFPTEKRPVRWQKRVADPSCCYRGYHVVSDYRSWMQSEYANRSIEDATGVRFEVWEVEVKGQRDYDYDGSDKFAVETFRFVRRVRARAPKDL